LYLFSCPFEGTREQLAEHLEQCKFEGLKGFLSRTDDLIRDLQEELKRKDDDITFLRSMLASLSEKVDQYEKNTVDKIGKFTLLICILIWLSIFLHSADSLFIFCLFYKSAWVVSEELEERHDKVQREVVEAHQEVNIVMVSLNYTYVHGDLNLYFHYLL